jgi:regulator of cell morphogenesis and NO signaling
MDFFCANTKLVDLIHADYQLLPVINRFGIKLGFGDSTVEEICDELGVDVDFFLTMVNLYHNDSLIPEKEFLNFPITNLLDYLKKSHVYYKDFVISKNNRLSIQLVENSYYGITGIEHIHNVYAYEVIKFMEHMDYEEKIVFPYLLDVSDNNGSEDTEIRNKINKELGDFHGSLVEKLTDMTNIIVKYLKPENDDNSTNELLFSIFEFVKDISIHTKIEKSILLKYLKE